MGKGKEKRQMTSHTGQSSPSWIPIWEKEGWTKEQYDDAMMGYQAYERLQRAGLSGGLEESGLKHDRAVDHWEVLGQKCIRHHTAPRLMMFDIYQRHDCPIPLVQLQPQCTVEAIFEDGTSQTMSYNWQSNRLVQPLRQIWIGQTIFKIKNPSNTATGLLPLAARRLLCSAVRNNIQVRLVEEKIMRAKLGQQIRDVCRHVWTYLRLLQEKPTFPAELRVLDFELCNRWIIVLALILQIQVTSNRSMI